MDTPRVLLRFFCKWMEWHSTFHRQNFAKNWCELSMSEMVLVIQMEWNWSAEGTLVSPMEHPR